MPKIFCNLGDIQLIKIVPMAVNHNKAQQKISELSKDKPFESVLKQVSPLDKKEVKQLDFSRLNPTPSEEGLKARLNLLHSKGKVTSTIENSSIKSPDFFQGNIENFIGMAQIPIGLAGPILINGTTAKGDYFVPLATTEGALVASYHRGMKACRLSGGVTSVCLSEGVQRCPLFKFDNIRESGQFLVWVHEQIDTFRSIVKENSNYAQLIEIRTTVEGNTVILTFEYTTGDAAGQNMITICTDKICQYILSNFEIQPKTWYVESNYSGDKKATAVSFSNVRGKKVTAEIVISKDICESVLKSSPRQIVDYWQSSTLAAIQSASIGAQGHVANGLTALFVACGQDIACISESSIGLTRMELNANRDLYVALTLPSLIVGTVGGGTGLPTQKECLELLECTGEGSAVKFAEICCAVALAGELSIASALSAHHFTRAHEKLGRKK